MVLMDLEDEDEDNLHFLQELKQMITSTSQLVVSSALWTNLSSSL
jgi:hypothetical protein